MDDLVALVTETIEAYCPGNDTQPSAAARAIIPLVMEEAARIAEDFGDDDPDCISDTIAADIRSRASEIAT